MRKISLASTRVEIAKGASEIVVDDFIDSHLQERPKTKPELALTPEELAELRAPRPEAVSGTPVSRTDVRGLLQKRDERISHLEDELLALRRELDHIRRASRPSGGQGAAATPPELLDEPLAEPPQDVSAWRRVPPPARPLGGVAAPPRAKPSRPGGDDLRSAARDPRVEPDDEPTLEDSGTRLRSEALLEETLHIHTSAHGEPARAGSSLAPKTDVAAALLGAAAPVAPAAAPTAPGSATLAEPALSEPFAVDMPAVLSPDVPAVLQFDAPAGPGLVSAETLDEQMPAVLQFGPTPTPAPVLPALGQPSAHPVAAPSGGVEPPSPTTAPVQVGRGRTPWLLLAGLVTLLGLAGGAVAMGWVVLPWASSQDGSEPALDVDGAPTKSTPAIVAPATAERAAPTAVATAPVVVASAAPSASAAPLASAAPAASAAPVAEPGPPVKDPSLLSFQAYLTVSSSVDAEVVVQGVGVGRTNQKLLVRCGPRNIRLRATGGAWLSEGTHAKIECMHHTTVHIAAPAP